MELGDYVTLFRSADIASLQGQRRQLRFLRADLVIATLGALGCTPVSAVGLEAVTSRTP